MDLAQFVHFCSETGYIAELLMRAVPFGDQRLHESARAIPRAGGLVPTWTRPWFFVHAANC